jgi:hypothetical protein
MRDVSPALLALGVLWFLVLVTSVIKLGTDPAGDVCGTSNLAGLITALLVGSTTVACFSGGYLLWKRKDST